MLNSIEKTAIYPEPPMLDLFETVKRINEAQTVRYGQKHGFPVERHYTDEELAEANSAINQAEHQLNQTNRS